MTNLIADKPPGSVVTSTTANAKPASWSGVLAVTLCVFALVASEFLPVSLLTPLAADLGVSEGQAGYGISISGAFAVVTSLFLSSVAGSLDRKVLLLCLTGLMGLSGLIVGLAPTYTMYMVGRALLGVVIGGFWSMSAAVAIRLVPPESVAKALAVFNGGNALATVIAAPLGSYLGGMIGWRGAFLALVPVAMITFAWQWFSLPAMRATAHQGAAGRVSDLLKQPAIAFGMLAVSVFFMGQFMLFTYLRPFLETVTGLSIPQLSITLLVLGFAGFIGTVLIGGLLNTSLYRTLIVIPLVMAAVAVGLVFIGNSMAATLVLLGLWGLVGTAAPVAWWAWLAKTLPKDAETGGGLMVAVIQLSIALGSTIGGLLFDRSGYRSTFIASAALLLIASILAQLTAKTVRPKTV